MSRGPGRVQSAIIHAFESEPTRRFSVEDLAGIAFPDQEIGPVHTGTISRALKTPALARKLNLRRCRAGRRRTGGWHHVYERAD